ALARKPGLLLVDELAHTNVPGSRHAKRWEDVVELLDAGISVWATLNVQHVESLNDDVARITGIRPAETLPDRVLERADEIELVDLPPAELRERLLQGKIYRADNARRALEGFFREGNLAALREIALRRVAAHVDTDVQDWMRRSGIAGPWPTADRVLALVEPNAAAESVVRHAKRLADALRAPWTALLIERAGVDTEGAARVPMTIAAQLGADVDVLGGGGGDLVGAVVAAARARNATNLVFARRIGKRWRRVFGASLGNGLIRRAPDFALHVVATPGAVATPRRPPASPRVAAWRPWVEVLALVAATTASGVYLRDTLPTEAADMIYLAVVVGVAAARGTGPALLAAALGLLSWDFFFVDPLYTVTIDRPRDLITAAVFAVVALLTGTLAGRVRAEARTASARIEGLRRIGLFSRRLGQPTTEPELLAEIARQAAGLAAQAVVVTGDGEDVFVRAHEPTDAAGDQPLDEGALAAARWAWRHGEPTGRGTGTLPAAPWRFLPMQTVRGRLGVLGVRSDRDLDEPRLQALEALADQAAVALERVRLALEAARTEAMEETQRLRTALLASLGHDLRTPLTGIQGAAETLRTAWDKLPPETRADLLAAIEQDTARMTHFLASIAELTRLESGEIRPRLARVKLAELVEAAVARLAGAPFVAVQVAPSLAVEADAPLLEQALFNVLDNAVKYAPADSLIRVGAERAGGEVRVAVADEGIGVAAEDLPHVFDSFFRVRRGDRVASGTGLGLAIARGLLEAMGGRIAAQSPRPDAPRGGMPGTVVTLTLREASPQ
ncbi:MAG: sensor histidine kinase KdpD, partial [Acetobacteraceae bacterium]|nr:sensor histidine kinase KdpD [Acetobacteraceae bacterium]